jgi:hypothetical protein
MGGSSRRRSPLGLVRPDCDRQAVSILPAGGQQNVPSRVTEPGIAAETLISRSALQTDPEELPHPRRQIEGAPSPRFPYRSNPLEWLGAL